MALALARPSCVHFDRRPGGCAQKGGVCVGRDLVFGMGKKGEKGGEGRGRGSKISRSGVVFSFWKGSLDLAGSCLKV